MSKYYMVDVKSITSKTPRSTFDVKEVERLAKSILAAGGLLSPILLQQTGIDAYEVLSGDLEFYAAARAKEISPREAEMVNAFVTTEQSKEEAIEQFQILHKTSESASASNSSKVSHKRINTVGNEQLASLETRIDELVRDFKQTRQQDVQVIEKAISRLQSQMPSKVDALDIFNHSSTLELMQEMARIGIKGKTADKLINGIEKARETSTFTSFKDVIQKIDGLADRRMLSILDGWGGMYMGNDYVPSDQSIKEMIAQVIQAQKSSENGKHQHNNSAGQVSNLEARLDEFASDFEQIRQQDMQSIGTSLETLQKQLPIKVNALEIFNHADISDLTKQLLSAGIKGKTAEKIIAGIEKGRRKSTFTSLREVIKGVDGLAEGRMLTMLDSWASLY